MNPPADLLITNARVFTADAALPWAEAVAVRGDRIAFVGRADEAGAWRGPRTRVVDAKGRSVLPGFIDSHYHLLSGSLKLDGIGLESVRDLQALAAAVARHAEAHPESEWLQGYGLRYNTVPGQPLGRGHLDAIVSDRPMILFAYDMHTAWANTRALEIGGILRGGPTGPNSEIVMGEDGLAIGELREPGAYSHVLSKVPPPDEAHKRKMLHRGMAQAAGLGITSIHNMHGNAEKLARYAALEDAGELALRIYCPYDVTPDTPLEALAEAVELKETHSSEMVRSGFVKFFMDGVIESYTALLFDDYADRPGWKGDANYSAEHFTRLAVEADRLGLQIAVHAIGDAAVRRTLDGYEAAQKVNGRRDSRHRVEHIEVIHPDDVPRFAELGVIASMQPLHAPMEAGGWDIWPQRVGEARWPWSFAWMTLRRAGARLVFGSDWPVASQSPMQGLHAALNRPPWLPDLPDQRHGLAEAILSYTRDAAYAEFQENQKGRLRPGMLADLVVLSEDLFSIPAESIQDVRVLMTVCGGKVVYEGD